MDHKAFLFKFGSKNLPVVLKISGKCLTFTSHIRLVSSFLERFSHAWAGSVCAWWLKIVCAEIFFRQISKRKLPNNLVFVFCLDRKCRLTLFREEFQNKLVFTLSLQLCMNSCSCSVVLRFFSYWFRIVPMRKRLFRISSIFWNYLFRIFHRIFVLGIYSKKSFRIHQSVRIFLFRNDMISNLFFSYLLCIRN